MNKYQARLIISVMATLIFTITGTGIAIHYGGIWYGLLGFVVSALMSGIGVVVINLVVSFYDDMGEWQ